MEAVRGNRETVGGEVSRHRVEVLEKLEAMRSERQGQYEELIGMVRLLLEGQQGVNELRVRYLEAIEESSEREKRYQETVIGLMREYTEGIKQVQRASRATRSAWSGWKRSGAAPRPSFYWAGLCGARLPLSFVVQPAQNALDPLLTR
jgi:hypothetical protein